MHEQTDSPHSVHPIVDDLLGERIEALAGWIQELDAQVRATSVAGDKDTLKELRRALELWSKRDPKFEEKLTNRVDVLADRLATLSSAVNTTAAAITRNEGDLACLRKDLAGGASRTESVAQEPAPAPIAQEELAELRRALADLSSAPPSRKDDRRRVDVLNEKLDNVSERLDTLAKTVATTAAGLAGREGELAALRRTLDDEHELVEDVVSHLREGGRPADAKLEVRLTELAAQVKAAAAGATKGERAVAALRADLAKERTALAAESGELREALATLASHVDALERRDVEARTNALDERLASLVGTMDELAAKLHAVSSKADGASSGFAAQELELATLHRQVAEASARADGSLAELAVKIEALETDSGRDEVADELAAFRRQVAETGIRFDQKLSELRAAVDATSDLDDATAALAARIDQVTGHADALAREVLTVGEDVASSRREVRELTTRLDEVDRRADGAEADLRRSLESLGRQVAELEKTAEATEVTDVLQHRLEATVTNVAELGARLTSVSIGVESAVTAAEEQSSALTEVRDQVTDASARFERRLAALQETVDTIPDPGAMVADLTARLGQTIAQVDALSHRLAEKDEASAERISVAVAQAADVEEALGAVRAKLETLDESSREAAAELSRVTKHWSIERSAVGERLASLETLLDEVAARPPAAPPSEDEALEHLLVAFADRIEAMEQDRPRIAAEASAAASDELTKLGDLVAGLGVRLNASERQVAALTAGELGPVVEELAQRLDRLERAVATPKPHPGEGRLRVELKALELRAEHLEAAARENREAVLIELERLAASVEERLQLLEAPPAPEQEQPDAPALGEVVPIRSSVET